jgi:hypothetical protein
MTNAGKSAAKKKPDMRVVVFKDGDQWVAQALEHDICAQGHDLETVRRRLRLTVMLEQEMSVANGKEPFREIAAAPKQYHDMWSDASDICNAVVDDDDGIKMKLCA